MGKLLMMNLRVKEKITMKKNYKKGLMKLKRERKSINIIERGEEHQ
jgi:hypothetical protein